jgi:ankyrin repeat protein
MVLTKGCTIVTGKQKKSLSELAPGQLNAKFFKAIKAGNTNTVLSCLKVGTELNEFLYAPGATRSKDTPLTFAIKSMRFSKHPEENIAIIRLLLEYGANPNITIQSSGSGLKHTASYDAVALWGKKIDDHPDQQKELLTIKIIGLLLQFKADLNLGDKSPLQLALHLNYPKVARFLLEHRAIYNESLKAPHFFINAIWNNNPEMVQLLLDHGANPNTPGISPSENKPVLPLTQVRSKEVAVILLNAGANVLLNCANGDSVAWSTIKQAISRGNLSVIVSILTKRYSLETATAIALALMAGASMTGLQCAIL